MQDKEVRWGRNVSIIGKGECTELPNVERGAEIAQTTQTQKESSRSWFLMGFLVLSINLHQTQMPLAFCH